MEGSGDLSDGDGEGEEAEQKQTSQRTLRSADCTVHDLLEIDSQHPKVWQATWDVALWVTIEHIVIWDMQRERAA